MADVSNLKIRLDRAQRTHEEATALIDVERLARDQKTARLRALRLTSEAGGEPMAKRHVFHSSLTKQGWAVTEGGETVSRHRNQKEAETATRNAGRKAYSEGGLGQAVLHKSDGTIREERTYGKDPERTPG